MSESLLLLPLELQVALGGGYLAHAVAYGGLRRSTSATELALRSMAFGLAALLAFRFALKHEAPAGIGVAAALFCALLLGAFWRRYGMVWANRILSKIGIREDGIPDAWTALIQTHNLQVTQLSVHLKNGRTLYHNRNAYPEAWKDGLYFGSDGSMIIVVEEEELPNGTTEERKDIHSPKWGTRLTYIPADQVERVNVRTAALTS